MHSLCSILTGGRNCKNTISCKCVIECSCSNSVVTTYHALDSCSRPFINVVAKSIENTAHGSRLTVCYLLNMWRKFVQVKVSKQLLQPRRCCLQGSQWSLQHAFHDQRCSYLWGIDWKERVILSIYQPRVSLASLNGQSRILYRHVLQHISW